MSFANLFSVKFLLNLKFTKISYSRKNFNSRKYVLKLNEVIFARINSSGFHESNCHIYEGGNVIKEGCGTQAILT